METMVEKPPREADCGRSEMPRREYKCGWGEDNLTSFLRAVPTVCCTKLGRGGWRRPLNHLSTR